MMKKNKKSITEYMWIISAAYLFLGLFYLHGLD